MIHKILLVILLSFIPLFVEAASFVNSGLKLDVGVDTTSGGTLTLTRTSSQVRRFLGSSAHTLKLPDATTLLRGWWYEVSNDSSGTITVNDNGSNAVGTVTTGNAAKLFLHSNASTNGGWDIVPTQSSAGAAGTVDDPNELTNLGLAASVSANALTISLKQKDGSTDPTSGSGAVKIAFRSSTLTTGGYSQVSTTGAVSTVISSGSTLGSLSGKENTIFVYAINNAGTVELAYSAWKAVNEGLLYSTTAEGGAGAADSYSTLYSTTARTNVAIRLIGTIVSTQATAGTWATSPSAITIVPTNTHEPRSEIWLHTANGYGSTANKIPRFTTTQLSVGTAITYNPDSDESTNGASFRINETGTYSLAAAAYFGASNAQFGFSVNSTQLTTSIDSITIADTRMCTYGIGNTILHASVTVNLNKGDIVRPHYEGTAIGNVGNRNMVRITHVGK